MSTNAQWKAGGISVTGFSHIEADIPCQDANAYKVRRDGWLVAAVSDGAGSAKFSHIGAETYVSAVVDRFAEDPNLPEQSEDGIIADLKEVIDATTRSFVINYVPEDEGEDVSQSDFAATIIVVICNKNGGAFYHVGDGAGVVLELGDFNQAVVSKPQNGEYANETYFLTMENWQDYLRVTPFEAPFDTVLLMSDGVTAMAMTKGCEAPFGSFVQPVINYLKSAEPKIGQQALKNTLVREQVKTVTGDDKSLFWATTQLVNEE